MSTILKALRRLEEDGPTRTTDVGSRADALPATDPRAADELRDRILAEESAAQAGEAAERESDRTKRIVMIAAAAMLVLGVGVGGYVMSIRVDTDSSEALSAAARLSEMPVLPAASSVRPDSRLMRVADHRPSRTPSIADAPESIVEPRPSGLAAPAPNAGAVTITPPGRPVVSNSPPNEPPAQPAPTRLAPPPAPPTPAPVVTAAPEMALAAVTPTPATVAANSRPKAIVPDATPTPAPVVPIAEATALPVRSKPTYATNAPPNVSAPQPRSAAPSKTAASEREKGIRSSPSPRLVERLDQRGLPDLVVVRTAWHPNADRRSVKIRLEATDEILTLREGDAVGRLVVQTISPSAVLFKAGEVEIRRRVGEPRSGG